MRRRILKYEVVVVVLVDVARGELIDPTLVVALVALVTGGSSDRGGAVLLRFGFLPVELARECPGALIPCGLVRITGSGPQR